MPAFSSAVVRTSPSRYAGLLSALLVLFSCDAGCILITVPGACPSLPEFSPDTSTAAWVWEDYWTAPLNWEMSMLQTAYVHWCRTDRPESVRSVRVMSVGRDYGGCHLASLIHLNFSPDSRYLAVVAPTMLKVVDTTDGRFWNLTPQGELEIVSSLTWLSTNEIGYAAHTSRRGKYKEITDRTFWRQRINAPRTGRAVIYREEHVENLPNSSLPAVGVRWPLEHWSPRGSYAFYATSLRGRMRVLDVKARCVRDFGPEDMYVQAVAWRNDESAVACLGGIGGPEPRLLAMVIETDDWQTIDFASPLAHLLKEPLFSSETAWTADGQYLLINDLDAGGCAVRPMPFRCIRIADWLPSELDREVGYRYRATVHPLPVPGWIRAHDPYLDGYFVDYEGRRVIPIGQILGTWPEDGTVAGVVGYDKRLKLQRMHLPAPATRPASTQNGVDVAPSGAGQ